MHTRAAHSSRGGGAHIVCDPGGYGVNENRTKGLLLVAAGPCGDYNCTACSAAAEYSTACSNSATLDPPRDHDITGGT